jgi:uncharacterized protein (DUF1697 family)
MSYVALLRGVNVGGHRPIKMDALRAAFEAMGFQGVKTLLASGNVLFDTKEGADPDVVDLRDLAGYMEKNLQDTFGYPIGVHVRALDDLRRLVDLDPFAGVARTADTRLYVTFLSDPARNRQELDLGLSAAGVRVIQVTDSEVLSVLTLSQKVGTTELMRLLQRELGRSITTRNWDTITRIVQG